MRFNPETLETLGVFGYRRSLKGPRFPPRIRITMPSYFAATLTSPIFGLRSLYRLCRIGDDGKQKLIAKLRSSGPLTCTASA